MKSINTEWDKDEGYTLTLEPLLHVNLSRWEAYSYEERIKRPWEHIVCVLTIPALILSISLLMICLVTATILSLPAIIIAKLSPKENE
jgi:hypothetical protein